nr:unnamed protein product [Callosobruchus chinensis]
MSDNVHSISSEEGLCEAKAIKGSFLEVLDDKNRAIHALKKQLYNQKLQLINDFNDYFLNRKIMSDNVYSVSSEEGLCEGKAIKGSILEVLDDKNRAIDALKKQLYNQKLQLMYYFQKGLGTSKLLKLSKSCSAHNFGECMPVVLALDKFKKDNGLKSSLYQVYERMGFLDKRIEELLNIQELALKELVGRVQEFIIQAGKYTLYDFLRDPTHIDLLNNLLAATNDLKRQLEIFKISCNRLLAIEDERNIIVEQVYSLPADQRIDYNYLMTVQMENVELERQIKQILRENSMMNNRLKELNNLEEKVFCLQDQIDNYNRTDDAYIVAAFEEVNKEARNLLKLTSEQKFKNSAQKASSLSKFIRLLKSAIECDRPSKTINLCKFSASDLKLIEVIQQEIQMATKKTKSRFEKECEALKQKLTEAYAERDKYKSTVHQLQTNQSTSNYNQQTKLVQMEQERDIYKQQVEDLEVIREAYAQLVDRQPNLARRSQERQTDVEHLEKLNFKLQKKISSLKNIIDKQDKEIALQNQFIQDLRSYRDEQIRQDRSSCLKTLMRSVSFSGSSNYASCTDQDTYKYSREIIVEEKWKSKDQFATTTQVNAYALLRCSDNCLLTPPKCKLRTHSVRKLSKTFQPGIQNVGAENENRKNNYFASLSELMGNSELATKSKDLVIIDEYELMKDCINEVDAIVCPPIKKQKGGQIEISDFIFRKRNSATRENV